MAIWNPWHGCHKISPGCQHCYVYRRDESIGKDASIVTRTKDYDLPLKRNRQKAYKLQPSDGTVFTCMTSDFFLEEADKWRAQCWQMMKERSDLQFAIITKRIHRFMECIPDDWKDGYPNVAIYCTVENQEMADYRLPIYVKLPIRRKCICHEPMLGPIDIEQYLASGSIDYVLCGGESGANARACHYEWVLSTREQCMKYGVAFHFKQTGANFVMNGKTYHIERKNQMSQAKKANIDVLPSHTREFSRTRLHWAGKTTADEKKVDSRFPSDTEKSSDVERTQLSLEGWIRRDLFERITQSNFRSRFKLKTSDKQYVRDKGMDTIRTHAEEFISKRLAPAKIPNDGKQTPMKGHPVFLAQHACACCCRGCLEKWHGIPAETQLTKEQQKYVVDILMEWIRRNME